MGRTYADESIVGLKPDLQSRFVGRVLTLQRSEFTVLRKSYLGERLNHLPAMPVDIVASALRGDGHAIAGGQ